MTAGPVDTSLARERAEADRYDVCVIGSGAAGSVVAHRCVGAGMHVLVLEAGPVAPQGIGYWDSPAIRGGRSMARDAAGAWTVQGRGWTSRNVGGGTVYYGAASFRFREIDFDPSRLLTSDLSLNWPFPYSELAPFYDRIERDLRVARDEHGDPTAPPMGPALPSHPTSLPGVRIRQGALSLGLHPFPTPLAINTLDDGIRGVCNRCSGCIDHPCPTGAKSDAVTVYLSGLASLPNFTLLNRVRAVRLHSTRGRVESAECIDLTCRRRRCFRADRFVLAANAIQSAAVLLRSTSRAAPRGIGNDHDMVGRGLCLKPSEYVGGYCRVPGEVSAESLFGPFSTVSITDHYLRADNNLGLGGLIYESKPSTFEPPPSGTLYLRLEAMVADRPHFENRVRTHTGVDQDGVPLVALDYTTDPGDARRLEFLSGKANRILAAAGCRRLHTAGSEYTLGSGHLLGACRAGTDPRESVVDPMGRVHSSANLFVADGGYMPFPGGVNPTLTIQANALRIAEHLTRTRC